MTANSVSRDWAALKSGTSSNAFCDDLKIPVFLKPDGLQLTPVESQGRFSVLEQIKKDRLLIGHQ